MLARGVLSSNISLDPERWNESMSEIEMFRQLFKIVYQLEARITPCLPTMRVLTVPSRSPIRLAAFPGLAEQSVGDAYPEG
jgi:hypothetical protein